MVVQKVDSARALTTLGWGVSFVSDPFTVAHELTLVMG